MPELPEVETVVRTLRPAIVGGRIARAQLHRADILTPTGIDLPPLLANRVIGSIDRRGKRIVLTLDNSHRFYIHLGMSGRLTLEPPDAPLLSHTHFISEVIPAAPRRSKHLRLLHMRFRDPRRFGGIWWLGDEIPGSENMGPEPLSMRPAELQKQLSRTTRAIKTALLDQTLIAGLGNIYVDESLFVAGIHPARPANLLDLSEINRLNRAIKQVLRKAIEHRGSTLRDYRDAHGESGGFQLQHNVYARTDKPCRTCKRPIQRIVMGGRSTHFCPMCQKAL
jgi:formamidopyrimidine-DNA glycosylase